MYRRTLTLRIPVLVMALVVAIALTPGEMGDALRAFGDAAVRGAHQIGEVYSRLFD